MRIPRNNFFMATYINFIDNLFVTKSKYSAVTV